MTPMERMLQSGVIDNFRLKIVQDSVVDTEEKKSAESLRIKTPRVGLEPTTPRLTAECSTIELSRIIQKSTKEKLSLPFSLHLQNYISMIQFLTSFPNLFAFKQVIRDLLSKL